MMLRGTPYRRRLLGSGLAVCATLCAGCGAGSKIDQRETRLIPLTEFAARQPMPSVSTEDQPSPDEQLQVNVLGAGGSEARGLEQLREPDQPTSARSMYVVESLVGQVNGRPIYAEQFFEPIEDQLIAFARRESPRRFQEVVTQIVDAQLRNIVQSELFLAEAESQLSEQEQVGLLAFMRNVQEQTISARGGVESVTRSQLLEEGLTLDEYLEIEKDKTLIRKLVSERIAPRVIISWQDIQREYERNYAEFNPPAFATIWRIILSTERDAEQIQDVRARLESGEPFESVAASLDGRQGGEYGRFKLGPNGLEEVELADALREQLAGLSRGEWVGPFEVGTRSWWLYVAEVDQPEQRSVYDPRVQRQLTEILSARRFEEERLRFMDSLLEEGIYDELTAMRDRLILIALQRYSQ